MNKQAFQAKLRCHHEPGICPNDATWLGFCPDHGGKVPKVGELIQLVSRMAGWGEGHHVMVNFCEVYRQLSSNETEGTGRYTYTTVVEICGDGNKITAADKDSLEMCLFNLARQVCSYHVELSNRHKARDAQATAILTEFISKERP